ncbi:nuclease-related domain-containing protein [Salibacterium aidingense]|uniref:nuclease-related domain-containing protein n=1 Tax=Salibacterium aidingense TaxID=384933 RepID=UPI003BED33BE
MIQKPSLPSLELLRLRYLNMRMNFSPKDRVYYQYLEKGHEGEQRADDWLRGLSQESIVLHDLLLEVNFSTFQIDSLVITQETIYMFEVKNYDGDYIIKKGRWYKTSGKEIKNPLLQLERTETLLRQFFQFYCLDFSIQAYLLFINPYFTLYQASPELPIILPTQLQSFMENWNKVPSQLLSRHTALAEQLLKLHIPSSPHQRIPEYMWDTLKKGMLCSNCMSFLDFYKYKVICPACKLTESLENAVLNSITEFQLLFPKKKITTNMIYEWTQMKGDKQRVHRILAKHYKQKKQRKHTYYV